MVLTRKITFPSLPAEKGKGLGKMRRRYLLPWPSVRPGLWRGVGPSGRDAGTHCAEPALGGRRSPGHQCGWFRVGGSPAGARTGTSALKVSCKRKGWGVPRHPHIRGHIGPEGGRCEGQDSEVQNLPHSSLQRLLPVRRPARVGARKARPCQAHSPERREIRKVIRDHVLEHGGKVTRPLEQEQEGKWMGRAGAQRGRLCWDRRRRGQAEGAEEAGGNSGAGVGLTFFSFPPRDKRFLKLMLPGGEPVLPFVLNGLSS